ncbi:twin-arginine translocase subunit TatC [Candidatus Latescibacterota bacterium]
MDDFDYENYGMEYDEYNPSGKDSSVNNEPAEEPEVVEENPSLVSLNTFDSQRLTEIELENFDYPLQSKYHVPTYYTEDKLPAVAVTSDNRRQSIHPLGVTEKPTGASELLWSGLDADGIYPENIDFTVPNDTVSTVVTENVTANAVAAAASGGSGGALTAVGDEKDEEEHDPSEMPFLDHLEEFRWALLKSIIIVVICMIGSWFLSNMFWATIIRLAKQAEINLISTKLLEGIMMKLWMTLVMGLAIALPFIFYFLWSFISPGLYSKEKRWILPLVFAATACFFAGASIAYFIIIPFILPFIKAFIPQGIEQMVTIGDFVAKMLRFTILFGIIFELPMVSYFLAKLGILKHTFMSKYRRYAIIIIFIFGAIFTPPDPMSQVMMALPLLVLYEISILVARFAGRNTIL